MSCIYGRYKDLILSKFFYKEIEFPHSYSLSIDHLEYCIMFICNRKVTLFGVYSKLTNSIGNCPPPLKPAYSTECLLYIN